MRHLRHVPLSEDDEQTIALPLDSVILGVHLHGEAPVLAAVVPDDAHTHPVTIFSRQTGGSRAEPVPEFALGYLGATQLRPGQPHRYWFAQHTPFVDTGYRRQ